MAASKPTFRLVGHLRVELSPSCSQSRRVNRLPRIRQVGQAGFEPALSRPPAARFHQAKLQPDGASHNQEISPGLSGLALLSHQPASHVTSGGRCAETAILLRTCTWPESLSSWIRTSGLRVPNPALCQTEPYPEKCRPLPVEVRTRAWIRRESNSLLRPWTNRDSNPGLTACKAVALPLSYRPIVEPAGVEPATSCMPCTRSP